MPLEPRDDSRLRALRSTELLDTLPENAFDRLTRLASRLLGAPVALLSLVDSNRQFFKSAVGLGDPWASRRETPLTHSFCQYATRDRAALVVDDARQHPVLKDNLAVRDLNVIAYAGVPLIVDEEAIGSFCVIDDQPRRWSGQDVDLLRDLADSVVSEIDLRRALRRAHDERALTDALIDGIAEGVLAVDRDGRFLMANSAARRIFPGRATVGETTLEEWESFYQARAADDSVLAKTASPLWQALKNELTDGLEFKLMRPDEREATWIEASGRPVRNEAGAVIAAVGAYRDITEKKRWAAALSQRDQVYRAVLEHLPNSGVLMVDHDLRYVLAEGPVIDRVMRVANVSEIAGQLVGDVSSESNREALLDMYRRVLAGEQHHLEIERGGRYYDLDIVPIFDGPATTHALVFLHDTTSRKAELLELEKARKALEAQATELKEAAVKDELSGLYNRRGFMLVAGQELSVALRTKTSATLFFVDLNGMKTINDTLGHEAGDRALFETAAVLREVFRASDVVARLGGDEFVVLAIVCAPFSEQAILERVRAAVARRNAEPLGFQLSLSVGTATLDPSAPVTLDELIAAADARMYEEKQAQRRERGHSPLA